jgi:hypothetical protein
VCKREKQNFRTVVKSMNDLRSIRNAKVIKGTAESGDMKYSRPFMSLLNNKSKHVNSECAYQIL